MQVQLHYILVQGNQKMWLLKTGDPLIEVYTPFNKSYWRKYEHVVLVNCLGGLSLPRKSVVRLTDHPGTGLPLIIHLKIP